MMASRRAVAGTADVYRVYRELTVSTSRFLNIRAPIPTFPSPAEPRTYRGQRKQTLNMLRTATDLAATGNLKGRADSAPPRVRA